MRPFHPAPLQLLFLLALTSCGGGSTVSPPPPPPPPPGPPAPPPPPPSPVSAATVQVGSNFFSPETVVLNRGGTVTWTWTGSGHTVTSVLSPGFNANTGLQNAGHTLGPITFAIAGTYHYICTVHGTTSGNSTVGMAGTIIVQ